MIYVDVYLVESDHDLNTLLRGVKQQTGAFVGPLGRGSRSAMTEQFMIDFKDNNLEDGENDDDEDVDEEDHLFERLSPRSKNLFSWRPPTRISSHACWPSRSFSINIIIMIMIVIAMITIVITMIMIVIMMNMMRQSAIV